MCQKEKVSFKLNAVTETRSGEKCFSCYCLLIQQLLSDWEMFMGVIMCLWEQFRKYLMCLLLTNCLGEIKDNACVWIMQQILSNHFLTVVHYHILCMYHVFYSYLFIVLSLFNHICKHYNLPLSQIYCFPWTQQSLRNKNIVSVKVCPTLHNTWSIIFLCFCA